MMATRLTNRHLKVPCRTNKNSVLSWLLKVLMLGYSRTDPGSFQRTLVYLGYVEGTVSGRYQSTPPLPTRASVRMLRRSIRRLGDGSEARPGSKAARVLSCAATCPLDIVLS